MSYLCLACALFFPALAHADDLARGFEALELKDYNVAIACFSDYIKNNPNDVRGYFGRAIAYNRKEEFDKSVRDWDAVLRLDPKCAIAYASRGIAYLILKKDDKAIADLTRAIQLDPKQSAVHSARAIAYFQKKEYDKAIADYTEEIRLDPKNALRYSDRADVYAKKDEQDKAIRDYTKAIDLDPTNAGAHLGRGHVYMAKLNYQKAYEDYLMVVWLDNKNAYAHNCLAWLLATCPKDKVRDGERAVQHATTACELSGWKDPSPVGTLAAASAETGNFKQAVKWQKKAIELWGADKVYLEEARQVLGLYEQGKPYREK